MSAMQPAPIRPFYYLDNFQRALLWVQERYADLLSDAECNFIQQFQVIPQPSQALLVRMVMRKGEHFRANKLQYAEIGDSTAAALPLIEAGWLRDDLPISLPELFAVLRKDELHQVFADQAPRNLSKGALLEKLGTLHVDRRPFGSWCPQLNDRLYSLTINALFERLRLLFFGNLEQSWAEFVLADLGIFRYEQVPILPESRGFRSRTEVDQYLHLSTCRDAFYAGEAIEAILEQLGTFHSDNPYLASRHGRLLFKLARQLEREEKWSESAALYQRCDYPGARQRHIRVLEKQADYTAAHALASSALLNPESDSELQLVERALRRLTRKIGQPRLKRPGEAPAGRIDLLLPPASAGVEQRVREHFDSSQAPVHYVENSLINSLFGLLCWDAIFAPVPGAFFHPFHSGPVDLHEPRFRERRAALFNRCFAHLASGEYRSVIRHNWQAKYGIQSPFVFWGMLDQTLLEQALACLPAAHLHIWFERLLADIRANRTGMPDLIQFWPQEQRYRMIEVKGPGDRLQDNQRRWLALCAAHGMPVDVCYVQCASA